jgi:hypothetical protein
LLLKQKSPSATILLNYNFLFRKLPLFRSLTGLELCEFDSLYSKASTRYEELEAKRLARENRKRDVGAGHPFKLPLKERLLMFLMYYRLYITSTLTGVLFDLDQSNVLKDIHKLEPLVKEILPIPKKLHSKVKKLRTVEDIVAMFPELKAFTDATEQEIPRPKSKVKRKTHYSGKKKRHTVKTQLTVNQKGVIVHKSAHSKGSTHDSKLFKWRHPDLPDNVRVGLDLGYDGVDEYFPWLNCVLPIKRRSPGRGKSGARASELSFEQKAFNRQLSRERVVVEHTNSRVKKFLIWGGEFRNRPRLYDVMTDIVCGLINFRVLGTLTV